MGEKRKDRQRMLTTNQLFIFFFFFFKNSWKGWLWLRGLLLRWVYTQAKLNGKAADCETTHARTQEKRNKGQRKEGGKKK